MNVKKNIPLILGLSIPVLMILFVAGSIYLPGLFSQPEFDFLYATGDNYRYNHYYSVKNDSLVKHEVTYPAHTEPRLYLHNIAKNESKEISFDEAQELTLNPSPKSPDGFEIDCGRKTQDVFFIFTYSRSDCSTQFIIGHNTSRELNLNLSNTRFQFLGWVIK